MKLMAALVVCLSLLSASVADARSVRKFHWSGENWTVRHTYGPSNPGKNIFSDSKRSVWVDSKKRLNLRIDHGRAVEVIGEHMDYGTFTWSIASGLRNLDRWRVIGLFVWRPDGNEQDLEFARWGVRDSPIGWSVGWTRHERTSYTNFSVTSYAPYKVRLSWTPAFTHYSMVDARGTTLIDVSYPHLYSASLRGNGPQPRMNYWLWPGVRGARLTRYHRRSEHPVLRLNSFSFTPQDKE